MTISKLKTLAKSLAKSVAVAAAFAFTASVALPDVAHAQGLQCGKRTQMVKTLDKRFKEARFAMGLASNINLLEVFISKKGTWTILSTRANGTACIVAAGKSWINMPPKLTGDAVNY